MDAQRLKDNFAFVAQHGDEVALFFYSDLFVRNAHLREMFPIGMTGQRDKLLGALGRIVSQVDDLPRLVPFLQQLGRDHRKSSVVAEHYPEVGASLVSTLRYFSGPQWTDELAADWTAAYGLVAQVMVDAANEELRPAWWNAQVISHERRRHDIAVFQVVPDQPLHFLPGQSVAVEVRDRPRLWRYLSMANSPRADHTLEFHVKLVGGGPVSASIVRNLALGHWMRLGPPVGALTLDQTSSQDVLLVAGGTGLAPLKAILDQIAQRPVQPRVHLFFGADDLDGLYDATALAQRDAAAPWLNVVLAAEAIQAETKYAGLRVMPGKVTDVVAGYGSWAGHDAYICGPAEMVAATATTLQQLGLSRDRIRFESFTSAETMRGEQ